MQQRNIIIFLIVLFIASSFWLFRASDNLIDPNVGKNWWAISFLNPDSQDLMFTIENHSAQTDFHWIVLTQNQKVKEGDEKIAKGNNKDVAIDGVPTAGKIVIEVTAGEEKKDIYKNL